jgi:uncharacterized protein YjiS (DUF1127 family)
MNTLSFPLPSGRAPRGGTFLAALLSAFREGIGKARRYQVLTRKSDTELAALGISREDLPRHVMFGAPRRGSRRVRR